MSWFKHITSNKKTRLAQTVVVPMEVLAVKCEKVWPDPNALDQILQQGMDKLPYCHLIYAVDINGTLVSSNVEPHHVNPSLRSQSMSGRPFMNNTLPFQGLTLSQVYVSQFNLQPCITALHAVKQGDKILGFIAADFGVDELPEQEIPLPNTPFTQFRGDPSIRGTLFLQNRTHSAMDQRIDEVLAIIADLLQHRGIFHIKVHFSSSRISVWSMDNPYFYHPHILDEIIHPDRTLIYSKRPYTERAQVPQGAIVAVLNLFKVLRNADENIYLRSASLNLINGMIGLTFSCDGTMFINYEQFLTTDISFWFGKANATASANEEIEKLKRASND